MHFACNDRTWFAVVDDKLLFHTTMQGAGLPVPELIAIIHTSRRGPNVPCLKTAGELRDFLRDKAPYPLFGKPIDGMYSLGAFRADSYAAAEGELVLAVGGRQQLDGCAAEIVAHNPGYLLQRALWPHPEIAGRFGERLCSVQLLVFLTPSGPQIARAVCKIPTGSDIADNFWRAGNMLGAVEIDTGLVRRVVRGTGKDQEVDACHPDTGAPIKGMGLPDWSQTADLAATAALTLPGVRTQSWDIAITAGGPVLLEANFGGDLNLAQLAWGQGALDDAYRDHLCRCGCKP
jgi:hypothetical protein